MKMCVNEGKFDRLVRVLVGASLLLLVFNHTIGWWGLIGLIPLITGLVGICPLYSLLGISTQCKNGKCSSDNSCCK